MLSTVKRRVEHRLAEGEGDEGFTLIELLVVLLIIGILLAIAIPTFLSVTKGANNSAAQSNLTTALTAAKTYYTDGTQTYAGVNGPVPQAASTLSQVGTGLSYMSGAASTGPHEVSVGVGNSGSDLVLADYATGSKDCWGIVDVTAGGGTAVLGMSAVGTYYFVARSIASTTSCNAKTFAGDAAASSVSAIQGTFPSP